MGAGHIAINILYWTCTFNFNPKFQRRLPSSFRPVFSAILYPQEFLDFSLKIKVKIFGIFSHKPVLGSLDNTLTKFQVHPNTGSQAKMSKKLASAKGYFNKLVNLNFQASQAMGAGHIAVNILYWMCTFNFNPKFQRRSLSPFRPLFSTILYPQEFLDFSLKMKVKIFGIFSHKPVLISPDNILTKFQVHPNAGSQAKMSKQLASATLILLNC